MNTCHKLETKKITKSFNNVCIIKDVSIHLDNNEIVSIVGVSGVGKTTLFNVIAGLQKPDSGKVYLENIDVTAKAGQISYMQQKDLLLPQKTILQNVSLPLTIKGAKKTDANLKALEYFKTFGLQGTENNYPNTLSGGMRQRAALLRTYLCGGETMLLDEPFSSLDEITSAKMQEWFKNLCTNINLSAICITHNIEQAILISDRIYVMSNSPGSIVGEIKVEKAVKNNKQYNLSLEFLEYKKMIMSLL